jgi:hypothetical protein
MKMPWRCLNHHLTATAGLFVAKMQGVSPEWLNRSTTVATVAADQAVLAAKLVH